MSFAFNFFLCFWKFYACIQRNLNISLPHFLTQHSHILKQHASSQLHVIYIHVYIIYVYIHIIYPSRSTWGWSYYMGVGHVFCSLFFFLHAPYPPWKEMKQNWSSIGFLLLFKCANSGDHNVVQLQITLVSTTKIACLFILYHDRNPYEKDWSWQSCWP